MFGLKVFAATLAVLTISACKDENNQTAVPASAPVVEAIKVEPHNVQLSFEYAARVQGSKETEVRARVGGILLKRNYVEGSKVKEGDVLFQIDPEPFEVELLQAKAELSQNQANLKAAETQWERVSKLFKERIVSEKSRDEALANLDSLKATTALAEAKVKSAQLNLNYTTVRAPISGMTSMETQSEGSLIAVNTPMTTITQFDPAYVIFSASENEIFKLGTMVEQGLIVNPRHSKTVYAKVKYGNGSVYGYDGEINFVNPSIDESTGTLKLRAVFPNPEGKLVPGQFVRLLLEGLIRKDAIVVPQEAVMQSPTGSSVYRINSQGLVEAVPVTVGLTTPEGNWIIDKGLNVRPGMPAKAEMKEFSVPSVSELPTPQPTEPEAKVDEGAVSNDDVVVEYLPLENADETSVEQTINPSDEANKKADNVIILEEVPSNEASAAQESSAETEVYTDKVLSQSESEVLIAG